MTTLEADLETLEGRLANPCHDETPESLRALLAPGVREYGSSGREYDGDAILNGLLSHDRPKVRFTNFSVVRVGVDAALVTYVSHLAPGSARKPPVLRSSLWQRQAGFWRLVFHQGTRMGGEAAQE